MTYSKILNNYIKIIACCFVAGCSPPKKTLLTYGVYALEFKKIGIIDVIDIRPDSCYKQTVFSIKSDGNKLIHSHEGKFRRVMSVGKYSEIELLDFVAYYDPLLPMNSTVLTLPSDPSIMPMSFGTDALGNVVLIWSEELGYLYKKASATVVE